jgi:hypothetical protein
MRINPVDWVRRKFWNRRARDQAEIKSIHEYITPKFYRSEAVSYSLAHYERRRLARHQRLMTKRSHAR